jgi:hypothetical protein
VARRTILKISTRYQLSPVCDQAYDRADTEQVAYYVLTLHPPWRPIPPGQSFTSRWSACLRHYEEAAEQRRMVAMAPGPARAGASLCDDDLRRPSSGLTSQMGQSAPDGDNSRLAGELQSGRTAINILYGANSPQPDTDPKTGAPR